MTKFDIILIMTLKCEFNCPICQESYAEHNYHDDVRCLEIIRMVAKILRKQRDAY